MLDLRFVRENLELVKQKLADRSLPDILADFEELDRERRKYLLEAEALKARRNKVTDEIATLKKNKQDASAPIAEMRQAGARISELDEKTKGYDDRLRELLLNVPNIPHSTVPVGRTEADNAEIRRWGHLGDLNSSLKPIGILGLSWVFSISSAPPRSPALASPCIVAWARDSSGPWPTLCSTCTRGSTATPRSCRRLW